MKPLSFFATHPVFTREQFLAAIEASHGQNRRGEYLLRHHTATGRIVRLRRGLYASVPPGTEPESVVVDPYLLAKDWNLIVPEQVLGRTWAEVP